MTEVNENSDSAINSASIQLNEDDWLQLLQKLTPSSIESLQQTLKRLQTPEHITTDKPNSSMSLISRSPAIIPSQPVVSQAHPIVMSLGMTKAPITPVMAMPHVLNISKNTGNPVPGRIVLPSSALLITPPSHGQTYSLDSCVPVADLSRLVVTTGCLPNTTTGLITTTTIPETFSSLNTLANAAVAMAANASHWSTSVSVPSTTTVQTGNSFRFSPNPFTSTATGTTISSSSSMTGLIHSSSNSTIDLNTPILSGLGSTSLTVYPVHVSANGSTVLVAASPSTTTIPTIQDTSKSCFANNPTVSIYSSSSFGNCLNSVGEITTLSPLSVTCNSNLSINSVTSPTPVHTSTPRGKPKFKALWESTLSNNDRSSRSSTTVTSASGDSGIESLINFEQTTHRSLEESATTTTAQTSSTLSTNSLSKISRSNKRQSPMLGLKSIGQTPKRLAATAASSLTQDNKSNSSDGCRKKFLLICSPPKSVHTKSQMESDSSLCLSGGNNLPESVLLSTNTSTSSIELDTHNPTTGQLMTPASDDCMPTLVVKASERNATTTSTSATTTSITTNDNNNNNNPLKQTNLLHFTGSNVSSSRESSDIADSDPIGCEVLIGKTFESGRRSLKEEPVSDDEARRRAKRRERNRVAAAKCRQRRQDQIEELQQRVDALTRTGQELRSSLHSLDLERTRLETLIEEHKIAGCPAAEKVLSLNKNYSDNSGCFESYVDNLKIDESMMDSSCCDDKFEVVSSPVVTVISDRLPVSSLTSSTSVIASTAVSTVTTSNSISGGGCGGNGKTISNLVNLHPNLPKLDIHCHNNANNNNSRSTGRQSDLSSTIANNVSLIPSNSIVITAGVAPIAAATMMSTTASLGLITSSSCNEDHNNRLTSTSKIESGTCNSSSSSLLPTATTTSTTRRPSTLLPALSTSSAQPLDVLKAQRQALAKVADGMNQVIPSLSSNATSCFWSSADLQNLSPILTPSTWKLLKNLTSTSNNNTNNSGSGSSSSNNSSIQQSFLVTPTLSPLYSALPTQTFASLTSMESLRSLSNNNNNNINNNSISVPVNDGSNPLSDVNNNSNNSLSVNPILIGSQNSNVSLLLSSSKVAFGNCDNNNNNNNNNNTRKSESSHTITTTTTTTTTTITSTTTTNGNNNSSISITDELSRSIQIQQSTQLNAQ